MEIIYDETRVVGHHPTAYNYIDPKGLALLGAGHTGNVGSVLYVCVFKITIQS